MIVCASSTDIDTGLLCNGTDKDSVDRSLLSGEAPCGVSGLTTDATFGALVTSAAASLTPFAYLESVSFPVGACRTIGLVPLAWLGNDLFRVSVARWLSVPGNDRLSFVLSPRRWE